MKEPMVILLFFSLIVSSSFIRLNLIKCSISKELKEECVKKGVGVKCEMINSYIPCKCYCASNLKQTIIRGND